MKITLKPLAEQVIVITGASSGIGLVTAKRAAAEGAKVVLVARNEASLREAVEAITAAGGDAIFAVADVGDIKAVRAAAAAARTRYGRIDTWVNNAGTAIYGKLIDTPLDEHEQLFRTNYFGAVHGALTAVEHLREKGGAIITVGSIASELPSPILSAYSASKHAAKGFVDALRMELTADALSIAITGFFVYAFMRNDIPPEPYSPNIIYFKNYAADRTDAQIKAQQEIDKVDQDKRIAAQKAREEKLRSQFKQVDDAMSKWGL